jgi:hypothetical protein
MDKVDVEKSARLNASSEDGVEWWSHSITPSPRHSLSG